jgi:hypothetical protein
MLGLWFDINYKFEYIFSISMYTKILLLYFFWKYIYHKFLFYIIMILKLFEF